MIFDQARKPRGRELRAHSLIAVRLACLLMLSPSLTLPGGLGVAHAATAVTGINAALVPQGQTVTPGADFTLDVEVTDTSEGFNGWEATIAYDPAALTYVPQSPTSKQQGCLMTGVCSNSCGSLYLQIEPASDSVYVLDALLCAQTFVTAPGQLFTLHFRASNTPQQTRVYFRQLAFYSGSHVLAPLTFTDAQVGIGMPAAAVDPGSPKAGLRLSATPNPARGAVTFALESEHSGEQEISVHDVQGRTVRVLSRGWQPAGSRQMTLDGSNDSGGRAAPGVYLVTLRVGSLRTQSRVTLLD